MDIKEFILFLLIGIGTLVLIAVLTFAIPFMWEMFMNHNDDVEDVSHIAFITGYVLLALTLAVLISYYITFELL